jgi:hypothetical protein
MRTSSRGSILILAVIIIGFLVTWSSTGLRQSTVEHIAAERDSSNYRAIHLAEAGLDQVIDNLRTIEAADDVFGDTLSNGTFVVEQPLEEISPLVYRATIHGAFDDAQRSIEAVLQVTPLSLFRYAAFGDEGVTLDGNPYVDSYDSRSGEYDEVTNANGNGDVGTNDTSPGAITMDGSNVYVDGQLSVGPNVTDPETIVTGFDADKISGDPPVISQPEFPLPAVQIPEGVTCNPLSLTGAVVFTLPSPGTYCFSDLAVQGGAVLTATGPVTVYLTESLSFEGNSTIGVVNDPTKFLFLMASGTEVEIVGSIEGNAEFYGAMYGPDAAFSIAGNAEIYGSVIGNEVTLAGNAELHYDEALADVDILSNEGVVDVLSWREE